MALTADGGLIDSCQHVTACNYPVLPIYVLQGADTSGSTTTTYTVVASPSFPAAPGSVTPPSYDYSFFSQGTGLISSVEIPLFSASAITSIGLLPTGWTYEFINKGDAGWDWSFSANGGPKSAFDNISTVLKLSGPGVDLSQTLFNASFSSPYAPVTAPYQVTMDGATAYIDPPIPGNPSVPEPSMPALISAAACGLALIRRNLRS